MADRAALFDRDWGVGDADEDGYRLLPSHYRECFGCGKDHPTGLHLRFHGNRDELRVRGSFTVRDHHQGAPGLAHGGIIAAAADEGMGYLVWLLRVPAVTGRLDVNYRRPVPVGSVVEMEGEVTGQRGRQISTRVTGTVDGEVVLEAKAVFVKVDAEHFMPYLPDRYRERPTYNP